MRHIHQQNMQNKYETQQQDQQYHQRRKRPYRFSSKGASLLENSEQKAKVRQYIPLY